MSTNTTNYNLKKETEDEFYSIDTANENLDKIDAALTPTADPAQVPTGSAGKLSQWVSWITNRIKAITGGTNWYDSPATTLQAANTHHNAAAPHSGHETPAGAQSKVDTHANLATAHNATSAATANRIIIRDANGRAKVAAPAASDDIARKDTVDAVQSNLDAHLADFATFKGDSNDDISIVKALFLSTDTRSLTPTVWDTSNRPTTLQIKDGSTVLGTITITYNSSGKITQLVLVASGKTITYTQTFDGTGKFTGRTKAVV